MTGLAAIRRRGAFPATLVVLLLAVAGTRPAQSQQIVDLELVLAVDASASVDSEEFDLQVQGFAEAFRHPEVIAAIRSIGNSGIAVAVVQWAGLRQQALTVNWTLVGDAASGEAIAGRITDAGRRLVGATHIDNALRFSIELLADSPFQGRRQVIDVSGDGEANIGASPHSAREAAVAAGITINGLAVLNEVPDLARYYGGQVVGGAGSFLMTAQDYNDFAIAIRLKLIQEILGAPVA